MSSNLSGINIQRIYAVGPEEQLTQAISGPRVVRVEGTSAGSGTLITITFDIPPGEKSYIMTEVVMQAASTRLTGEMLRSLSLKDILSETAKKALATDLPFEFRGKKICDVIPVVRGKGTNYPRGLVWYVSMLYAWYKIWGVRSTTQIISQNIDSEAPTTARLVKIAKGRGFLG